MFKIDKEKIFWRTVENETVVLNIDTGIYYTLDGSGKTIWDMMASGKGEDEIIGKVVSKFDVDTKTVAKDLESLIKTFKKEGLIEGGK